MADISKMLSRSLTGWDNNRARSKQVEVGPSSLGGCKRQTWHTLKQTPTVNFDTESLAAILGTFIHAGVSDAIKREDPFGDNLLIEQEFFHQGLKGHCDLFIIDEGIVVDWKTTTKKNLRYFPSQQQRWQVQVYGWLLSNNGYTVNQVALAAIPRDGHMSEIRVHAEPYDLSIAEEAIDWLGDIEKIVEDDAPPPAPEKHASYCAMYCRYFDPTGVSGCPSTTM
jgi:CRISPR/Cas system-associated exonuclease Cas4 (RecB family)